MGKEEIGVRFGALAPPLSEQLPGMLQKDTEERMQGHMDAVTRLHLHNLLTDSESLRVRRRILSRIAAAVK